MRYNLSRHSLLKKLAEKLHSVDNDQSSIKASLVGLTLDEIDAHLKRNKTQRELILSGLGEAKEIEAFRDGSDRVAGYFITDNIGLNSVVEKKYLNRNNDIIVNWLKNSVQIFIPIASLTIAILALSLKISISEKITDHKIEALKSNITNLNRKIDALEIRCKKIDTVKLSPIKKPK